MLGYYQPLTHTLYSYTIQHNKI